MLTVVLCCQTTPETIGLPRGGEERINEIVFYDVPDWTRLETVAARASLQSPSDRLTSFVAALPQSTNFYQLSSSGRAATALGCEHAANTLDAVDARKKATMMRVTMLGTLPY